MVDTLEKDAAPKLRPSDYCKYPDCEQPDPQPPYRYLRDGVPSVTAISGMVDLGKAKNFAYAASLIAATVAIHDPERLEDMSTDGCTHEKDGLCAACKFLRGEFAAQWDAKAALGSHVHHMAQSWAEGRNVVDDEMTKPYMDAVEGFYVAHQPAWLMVERTVCGPADPKSSYRGKFDGICVIDCPVHVGQRCRWLIDWKTGRHYAVEQTLQLSAYRFASLTEWEGKTMTVVGTVPVVDHAGVVMLGEDGFDLRELPADLDAFNAFRRLRESYGWYRGMEQWAKAAEKAREA